MARRLLISLAVLCIQCSGATDTNPLTAAAKASQLIFGGVTSGQGFTIKHAQTLNLVAGGIASGAADMSTSLVSDFRVGFLLRTPPKLQFISQAVGTFIAVVSTPSSQAILSSWNSSDKCSSSLLQESLSSSWRHTLVFLGQMNSKNALSQPHRSRPGARLLKQ